MFTTGFTKIAYNMDHNNQGLEFRTSDTAELPNVGPGGMAPKGIPTYQPAEGPKDADGKPRKLNKREAAQLMMYKMSAGLSDSGGSDIASGVASQLKWTSSSDDVPENQGQEEKASRESYKKYLKASRSKK